MTKLTCEEIYEVYLDTPIWAKQRRPKGRDDWGDPGTTHLQVKRVGATPTSPWDHFGTYYGHHKIGYVIAIKGQGVFEPVSGEVFDTMDAMKLRWELD